jgi:hypothetical protein
MSNEPVGPLTVEVLVVKHGRITLVDTVVTTSSGKTAALVRSVHLMVNLKETGPHRKK